MLSQNIEQNANYNFLIEYEIQNLRGSRIDIDEKEVVTDSVQADLFSYFNLPRRTKKKWRLLEIVIELEIRNSFQA